MTAVYAVDTLPERADELVSKYGLAGTFPCFEDALTSTEVDAVAIFTQRWTHGPLVVQALRAGKHVYSAVPMAISAEEIGAIIDAVRETGLTYMMGETSHYNPAVVYARAMIDGGRVRPAVLRRGRLPARHGPRLLRRLQVLRR